MAKVNVGFGVVTGLSFAMFAGCSQDAAPGKPVSTDSLPSSADKEMAHADHGSGDGQGHVGMAGMGEMARLATLIVDAGGDDLRPGLTTTLKFHLEREGTALKEFILLHERPMHFIVVRDALDEFQHLHPQVASDGTATVDIAFPTAGTYWVFVDCQPKGEGQQTIRHEMRIAGERPAAPPLQANVPVIVTLDDSQSEVSAQKGESEWQVTFLHSDLAGKPLTDLEPYLGAMGHLVVIGEGTGEYVHAHAELKSGDAGKVTFAAHFARPGMYKAWGQFLRKGQVFTVPAVIAVE